MILLTGATGFIGRAVAKELVRRKYKVRAIVRDEKKAREVLPKGVSIVRGDLLNERDVKNALKGVDTIIHIAGTVSYSKPSIDLYNSNYLPTKNLIDNAKRIKKLIFTSSVSVYGKTSSILHEDSMCRPMNFYGESKHVAEELIRIRNVKHVILRIAPVYGMGSPSWEKNFRMMENGFPIPKTSNMTHIVSLDNVVQSIMLSLKKGDGTYNIADKQPVKFMHLAESIVKDLGVKPKKASMWVLNLGATFKGMKPYLDVLVMSRHYSISKAVKELGYVPEEKMEGVFRDMVQEYKRNNGLIK